MARSTAVDAFAYDSFSALLAAGRQVPLDPANRGAWEKHITGRDLTDKMNGLTKSWYVGEDCPFLKYDDVARWMLDGWPQGVARLTDALGHIKMPVLADVRRRGVWSDVGDTLSLDRLYAGDTERCWRTTHRARAGAPPRLQVIVSAVMSAGTDEQDAFWRGAAATAFTDAACAAGYTVAVDTVQCVRGYDEARETAYFQRTRVKAYDAPVNVATLAALTAHPAALRVVTFTHGYANAPSKVNDGFGRCADANEDMLRDYEALDFGAIPLIVSQHCLSQALAQHWISAQIERLEGVALGTA